MARPKTSESTVIAVAQLVEHPGWIALIEEITSRREVFFANMARGLSTSRIAVDQREVDEKRGFWAGALWAVEKFPKQMDREDKAAVAAALAEEEERATELHETTVSV